MSTFSSLRFTSLSLLMSLCFVSGCDRLGLEDPAVAAALQAANAKATGSACRHAGRALEDCYSINPKLSRASIFAGWKEMNDYMRENNIKEITPTLNNYDSSASATKAEASSSAESSESSESASAESASSSEH